MKEETLKRVIAVIAVFGFSVYIHHYYSANTTVSLVKCPWWQGKKIGCFIYRLHCTFLLGGIFFKIEDKGFKWQSGFTPVTLLGKVSGKFETFRNKVLICLFIFP